MIPAAAAALPAFTNFASWLPDIVDRLARGIIDDKQAEQEVRIRYSEYEDELAASRAAMGAAHDAEIAARAKLPSEGPTPAAAPVAPTPPIVAPPPPAPAAAPGPQPSGEE